MLIIDIFSFIIDNFGFIIVAIFSVIILYSWISMFIKKDYKFITDYNKKYKDKILKNTDLQKIRDEIKGMEGRQFEIFCEWLFKNTGKYKSVILTPAVNDEGKDLIVIDEQNNKIFVECKRYTENATITEEYMIGRVICQKLVGAIVSNGISKGVIITTGNIHQNAWDYIVKLEKNSKIKIDIINLDGIMSMVQEINNAEVLEVVGVY